MEALWSPAQVEAVEVSLKGARSGHSTLLTVHGESGAGKTTFLREVRRRATGFTVLRADGNRSHPLSVVSLLSECGALSGASPPLDPFGAAQVMRKRLDAVQLTAPVVLMLDDFQWFTADAAELVGHVVRRSEGDRLLVAIGHQPIPPPHLAEWRRLTRDLDFRVDVALSGLSDLDAAALIRSQVPDADEALVQRLIRHTEGNPLYLRSILSEYSVDTLRRADRLPAPADLVSALGQRVAEMSDDSRQLLWAIAILGPGWTPLRDVAAVGGSARPQEGIEDLTRAGLLASHGSGLDADVRVFHGVVAAAITQSMPTADRRSLLLRAAQWETAPDAKLRYRFRAAEGPDQTLADEIAGHARVLHDAGDFRRAAELLRWSEAVAADPSVRESRYAEMLFELVLARDIDAVQGMRPIGDPVRSGLVRGGSLVIQRRWVDAVPALEGSFVGLAAEPDSRTRYRVGLLLAWTRVMIGAPVGQVAEALDQAASEADPDPALRAYHTVAAGQLRLQRAPTGQLVGLLGSDPAALIPVEDTHVLGWRGAVQALSGQLERGERDLREYQRRVQDGSPDATDGADFAILAYAQWFSGQWTRARVSLGIAVESRFSRTHPIVAAVRPLGPIGLGASDEAAEMLARARTALLRAPWPPALQVAFEADVLWHRVFGTDRSRAGLVADWRRTFGSRVQDVGGAVSLIWLLHLALALIWAGEPAAARDLAVRISMAPSGYPWAPGAAEWVVGLADERGGRPADARTHLRQAVELDLATLPLHRAHLTADLARVEAAAGDPTAGHRLLHRAAGMYATLGAQQQLPDLVTGSAGAWRPGSDPADVPDPVLQGLSEREREVVALVAQGLSYTQIATDLYVTRSTVAFHVGRILAKTNTASRHELVALVRQA